MKASGFLSGGDQISPYLPIVALDYRPPQANKDSGGWKSKKRTKSSYGKYDPRFQII